MVLIQLLEDIYFTEFLNSIIYKIDEGPLTVKSKALYDSCYVKNF